MEHNPYAKLNDGTEITYSDVKEDVDGLYTKLYAETVYEQNWCDMTVRYPGGKILSRNGYTDEQAAFIKDHLDMIGPVAFDFAMEEREEV